jgi:t-SNARE complex subunit (syntaxin)
MHGEQDAHLDAIYDSVQRLGQLSLHIHTELDAQHEMLEEAEAEMDDTQAAVRATNQRIKALIDANGGKQWCAVISCLVFIVVVLFFLILAGA